MGGVGCPSGPSMRSGELKPRPCGECGIGSDGISVDGWGAPEMTTSGGAGLVLSLTGDLRGVVGWPVARLDGSPPFPATLPLPLPLPKGVRAVEVTGDDGPELAPCGKGGVGLDEVGEGDLDFVSLDFVRERFCRC